GNPDVFYDYVVVLAWSGNCDKATAMFEKIIKKKETFSQKYVLKEAAKCYRNLKNFRRSVELYQKALVINEDIDTSIGLSYALSEYGEKKKALHVLEKQISKHPQEPKLKHALAYLYEREGKFLEAVLVYDSLLEKKKEKKIVHSRLRALSRLGAHTPALEGAKKERISNPALLDFLKGNFAARLISWNRNIPLDEGEEDRWNDLNKAIKILSEQLGRNRENKRALYDLMGARALLGHPRWILKTYKRLKQQKKKIPNWVIEIVADAFIQTYQPNKAISLLKKLLESDKENYHWRVKLYSAYVSKDDLKSASKVLNALLTKEASSTKLVDGIVTPNWKKVDLEIAAAWLLAFKDRLSEAQTRFQFLLSKAPHNSSIHSGFAHIHLWRGLPEKAIKEFQWILNYDPMYTSVRTGYAAALMDVMRYREAEEEVKKLSAVYPVTQQVQKILDRWKSASRAGISIGGNLVREERGGKDWGADLNVHSKLFVHKYKLDFNYSKRQSIADSDRHDYARIGLGLTYAKNRFFTFSQKVTTDPEKSGNVGIITSFSLTPNDNFSVSGKYDSFLLDMPLRARINNTNGKSLGLSLRFARDDSKVLRLHTTVSRFSDSNSRRNYLISYRKKVIPGYKYRAFLEVSGFRGTNSKKNAAYFNPERELSYSVTLSNKFVTVNLFRMQFIQHLDISLGQYFQKGFSAGLTADVRYEHTWEISAGKELVYGVHWKRRIYDGASEQTPTMFGLVRSHF
ncbi:MAG: poly-beta-1,6 N-acetyl-D-glucosamine export porin PgaA, partial [Nitrospinota bacterium]